MMDAMTRRAAQPPESMRSEARRLYGSDPAGYDAGRPDYPPRVDEILTQRCGLGPGTRVVEIGPGTGRVTRRLAALGASVVAVEPDPAMAAHLARVASGDIEVIVATFEDAALPHSGFDLAVAAMSFHWVDQAVGVPKLGRVIRPGGWAASWWTVFGDPYRPDPFRDATARLLGEEPGGRRPAQPRWFELDVAARCEDLTDGAGLTDVVSELIPWTIRMDAAQVRALYASMIRVRLRPEPERRELLDALVAIAEHDFNGAVERPFLTVVYTGRRPLSPR